MGTVIIGEKEWVRLGERLRQVNPERFARVYAKLEAVVDAEERAEKREAGECVRRPSC